MFREKKRPRWYTTNSFIRSYFVRQPFLLLLFFFSLLLLCVAFRLIDCFHDLFFLLLLSVYASIYSCKRENVVSVTVKSNLSQLERLLRLRSLCKSDRLTLRCWKQYSKHAQFSGRRSIGGQNAEKLQKKTQVTLPTSAESTSQFAALHHVLVETLNAKLTAE